VVVAEIDQRQASALWSVMTVIGPELALLTVVSLWASTFIVPNGRNGVAQLSYLLHRPRSMNRSMTIGTQKD
jgi:hypothetical protein